MSDHEQTLREMAAKLEVLAHDDECRAAEDDIDATWRQSRLDSAHDLHQRKAACLSGADALVREKARQLTPRGQVAGNPLRLLRAALVGMVGTDDPKELNVMELTIRQSTAPASDKAIAIDAIDALRATREAE